MTKIIAQFETIDISGGIQVDFLSLPDPSAAEPGALPATPDAQQKPVTAVPARPPRCKL